MRLFVQFSTKLSRRCLSTKNAFMSSKEGLVTIFEEMKRRWEVGEKRRGEEKGEGEKEREREGRRIVRGSKVSEKLDGDDGGFHDEDGGDNFKEVFRTSPTLHR